MNGLVERYENIMETKRIDFVARIDVSGSIYTDYQLLERLLNNYIMNAMNHVNDCKKVVLTVKEEKEFVAIEVFNTGNPISEDEESKIWKVFYKGIDSGSSESHGLGLSIVKTISDILQLTVGLRNEGDGVSFYVLLPKN